MRYATSAMFHVSPSLVARAEATEHTSSAADPERVVRQHGLAFMVSDPYSKSASDQAYDLFSKLEAALGRERLAILSGGAGREPLQRLIDGGFVDSFIEYVELFHPSLHAKDGRDFTSFMRHPRGSLLQYKKSVPYIHSPHRLTPAVLQALSKNFQDRSKKRPLVVVVLSALDLDGSRHGNESLGPLVSQNQNLVLAVEAGEKQERVIETLDQLAVEFGRDKRIQDVVFVGPGGPTRFDLAGSVRFEDWTTRRNQDPMNGVLRVGNNERVVSHDSLDAVNEQFQTTRFARRLLQILDTRWGATTPRIVFDSSLTKNEKPSDYGAGSLRTQRGLVDLIRDYSGDEVEILAGYGAEPGTMVVDSSGRPTTVGAPALRR